MVLYTQPGCPQCRMVHMLLDRKNLKYTEIQDVELMRSKGIEHTPVLEVEGKLLTGRDVFQFINGVM